MPASTPTRRQLIVGGAVGIGLIVAWAAWPRRYAANLATDAGEHGFGAWLKVGDDGHVVVAVPQAEQGQGVYTTLPQIVADELGADWRTVGVEPAPINPLYANPVAFDVLFEGLAALPADLRERLARHEIAMLTAASSSIRAFEGDCRQAAAAARTLLCKVAARRWGIDWQACRAEAGFIVAGTRRARFADLAADAARERLPDPLPYGIGGAGKLMGQPVARLDAPAKVDGSADFVNDLRLPDMAMVAIRQGPRPDSRLVGMDRAAAARVPGAGAIVEGDGWVAIIGDTWWAAERALDALAPRFESAGPLATTASVDAALTAALAEKGHRMASLGDPDRVLAGSGIVTARYRAAPAMHAAIEPRGAVARLQDGRLELWLATAAPVRAAGLAADAVGVANDRVTVYPMPVGGGFGAALEPTAAVQAATIAAKLRRPVSLRWSRGEDARHDPIRPPAIAELRAKLGGNGAILAWHAAIAAPATGRAITDRVLGGLVAQLAHLERGDRYAVSGALPPYRIGAVAIDHHPADLGVETGHLRGGADGYTAFFTECFVDELARAAGIDPVAFRIGMLGGNPRLARCLSTAASLGGWSGGRQGSGQGIACHAFRGSHVAVLTEAHRDSDGSVSVDRLVAAVDCGRVVNPDIVRQQVEGGLVFGMAQALGGATGFAHGMPSAERLAALSLPRLADTPDITVELIRSDEAPGGVAEIGVPAVAPAIANALATTADARLRALPLAA